ncbi:MULTISPECIES: ROK family protein [unclassified Brevundimonas]|uniref:ROK family protein n=1 Tax=unclassified Brevundimonas TaxID=2622653 RepID=UPI0025BD9DA7|nr:MULTISPECIES: ROK family protein [unclassified Brevundimonas]
MMRIGIDFGGTKIEAAALDDTGVFVARIREPNPGSYDAALALVAQLIARVEAEAGPARSVGLAIPGSPSPRTGLIRNANSTYLNDRRFGEDLALALGRPVRLANDANCLALSEALDGAGNGAASVCGVIVGTGCGGGLVVGGELVEGAHGVAAEIGHVSLPWPSVDEAPGPACWCGLRGCLETWVSGSGFQRDHEATTGRAWTAQAVVAAARDGDEDAATALDRYIDRLGRALAMVVNLVDPEVFVLGGGMSNVSELYDRLPDIVARHAFADHWDGRIVAARWGDSSGVRGAARLWND